MIIIIITDFHHHLPPVAGELAEHLQVAGDAQGAGAAGGVPAAVQAQSRHVIHAVHGDVDEP